MSRELLALEDIILYLNANETDGLYCENIEIIKTALKKQEQDQKHIDKITRANLKIGQENCRLNELVNKQLNDLTKLDTFVAIIKEKRVDIDYLIKSNNLNDYNNFIVSHGFKTLTQQEYDLLKEVLL